MSILQTEKLRLSKVTSPVQDPEVDGCWSQARTHSLDDPDLHTPKTKMIKMRNRWRCCRRSRSWYSSLLPGEEKAMSSFTEAMRGDLCGTQRSQTDSHPGTISPSPLRINGVIDGHPIGDLIQRRSWITSKCNSGKVTLRTPSRWPSHPTENILE